ncbi:hypothetical protein ACFLU6_09515, partial [Acidobacteriota bacterium]
IRRYGERSYWWGVYELADPQADSLDRCLRAYMPTSGAPRVPNTRQGYSRGGWQDYRPDGPFALRLLGRCWEEWRTVPMGYEISLGARSDNFLTNVDGMFTIGSPPVDTITVSSPVDGGTWNAHWLETVTWTDSGAIPNVKIELSTDGEATWTKLAPAVSNTGSCTVNVPNMPSNRCVIRVTGVENPAVTAQSSGFFTIQPEPPWPTLTVLYPNGGELWPPGGTETVQWSTQGTVADVGISLSTDEGASWTSLVDSTPNDGAESVSVPLVDGSICLVWIFDARNDPFLNRPDADPLDVSDGLFRIGQDIPPVPVGNTLRMTKLGMNSLGFEWAPDTVDQDWAGSNVYASSAPADVMEGRTAADLEPFRVGPGSFPDVPDVTAPATTFNGPLPDDLVLFYTIRYIDQAGNISQN